MSNATQKSGNSTLKWIFLGLSFIVLVTIISLGIKSYNDNHPKKDKSADIEINTPPAVVLPNTVIEYKLLLKGAEPIRVQKDGYKCDFYGGGKQYYNQPQNSTKEVWGGGACPSNLNFPNASYSDLSYYKEEVTVKCVFSLF